MTATEDDIIRDEQERSNLLRAIADVETALAVSTPGTRRVLENVRDNAMKRVSALDRRIEVAKAEQAAEVQAQAAAVSALAAKEKALSVTERETYSGFLKEEFFTKEDFGKLEQFYAHGWNRLTEGGKDELSHRVWEGVRHREYRFTELPTNVRDKEEDRIYAKFTGPSRTRDSLEQIPETDRNDFIHAYKAGKRDEAGKILDRESFRRNVSIQSSDGIRHQSATAGKMADDPTVSAELKPVTPNPVRGDSSALAKIKAVSDKLKDFTLDDSPSAPVAASVPNSGISAVNVRSPA